MGKHWIWTFRIVFATALFSGAAHAQLQAGWESQHYANTVQYSTTTVAKIANATGQTQNYNLFLGPSFDVATGQTRVVTIRAQRISGSFPVFHVGFHRLSTTGGYLGESGTNFNSSLNSSFGAFSHSHTATVTGKLRPRIAIWGLAAGTTVEFAIASVALESTTPASAPPVASPSPSATPIATQPTPVSPAGSGTCSLAVSAPVVATRNGQVIENLSIKADGRPGILVDGFSDVVIRNVYIEHRGAMGIKFNNAPRIRIENVSVLYKGAPTAGPNPAWDHYNIGGSHSPDARITRARVEKGSSGVFLDHSQAPRVSFLEGHDFRGPFPRGQLVQFSHSHDGVIEDFSSECGATSWTEDNINIWRSSRATIRRGLVDGNNSPSGIGVIFEHDDGIARDGWVEDVDAVRQGNGCFSAYPGINVTFNRTRCVANICSSQQGRGAPMSNALAWAGEPSRSSNLKILDSSYDRLCNPSNVVWDRSKFSTAELRQEAIVPRAPLRLKFCWQ